MVEILETPFPEGYYDKEGWYESLTSHYGEKQERLPLDVIGSPVYILVAALYDVIEIYGNFPKIVYNALGQTVDPLFEPEEYKTEIYQVLYDTGIEEDRPLLVDYAEGLLDIRNLFQKDEEFYKDYFPEEIEKVGYEKFSEVASDITRIHVKQVRKLISNRQE